MWVRYFKVFTGQIFNGHFDLMCIKGIQNSHQYGLLIYRGYIWYDSSDSTIIPMIKLWSDLHSQTTPHTRPYGRDVGCFSRVIQEKFIIKKLLGYIKSKLYLQKLSCSSKMFRTSWILIRLFPEIWINKKPCILCEILKVTLWKCTQNTLPLQYIERCVLVC